MTPEQETQIRELAYWDHPSRNATAVLAQVVLDLDAKVRELEFPLTASAATGATTFSEEALEIGALATAELRNSAVLSVGKSESPITAEELERRGTDPELEARAIDVILRCGWPDRKKHRVNVEPCVPVPVKMLGAMFEAASGISVSVGSPTQRRVLLAALKELIEEQEHIQALYVEALADPGPLPERAD